VPRPHPETTAERSVLATLGLAFMLFFGSDVLSVPLLARALVPLVAFVAVEAAGARGGLVAGLLGGAAVAAHAARGEIPSAVLLGALLFGALLSGWLTRQGFPAATGVTALAAPVCLAGTALYALDGLEYRAQVVRHLDTVVATYRTADILPREVAAALPTVRDLWVQFFPLLFTIGAICSTTAVYLAGIAILPALGRPPIAVGRFRFWRVPDAVVWILIAGLACLITRSVPLTPVGANLTALTLCAYGVAGLAIMRFFLIAWGMATGLQAFVLGTLLVGGALSQIPVVPAFSIALGFLDAWLDFRGLNGPPLSAGRESAIHQ
jgi:hypothetical protein